MDDGKGKGCTTDEFKAVLKCAAAVIKDKAAKAGTPCPEWLSFDNAPNHNVGDTFVPGLGFKRVPLSPYSPDMHKVIEHTFSRFKRSLHASIYDRCAERGVSELTPPEVRRLAIAALEEAGAATSIAKDLRTLPVTLRMVATPEGQAFVAGDGRDYIGTGGNWARESWR